MFITEFSGGLGNQMFQYAFGRYMQTKYNDDLSANLYAYSQRHIEVRDFMLKDFNISDNIVLDYKNPMTEIGILRKAIYYAFYAPYKIINKLFKNKEYNIFKKLMVRISNALGIYYVNASTGYINDKNSNFKNKLILGHWFWPEKVKAVDSIVRNELRVKTPLSEENAEFLQKIKSTNSVGVHIRRGDYIKYNMIICDISYYERCMGKIAQKVENPVFYIFSDDISWVKENLNTKDFNVVFIDNNNSSTDDMRLLYSCKHFIISNSTFSWWGAYLGDYEEKIVYAPSKWKNNMSGQDVLLLDEWIKEEV